MKNNHWKKISEFTVWIHNNGDMRHQLAYQNVNHGALVSRVDLIQYNDDDLRIILQSTSPKYNELVERMRAHGADLPSSLDSCACQHRITTGVADNASLIQYLSQACNAVPEIALIQDEIVKAINEAVNNTVGNSTSKAMNLKNV